MAYLSLYRKHRPSTFAEVVGQEHVTRTLVNAITEDRLHHAYLFTGQRGTGKTSTARILAAAVNCESGPTSEPCGDCEQCTSIIAGNNVDVIELDMASHGGVDDARELRDRAVFAPAAGRKKVYILDEVHMASTAAFNALLKVVEEPPSHVLFAMATTDPQKVLPTIMSRVQRLDLRRVPGPALTAHLRNLGEIEGFTLDDEAAAGVVAAGDGSVRDTLSVLEQVLAFAADDRGGAGEVLHVTADHVTRVLGATPFELVVGVVDAIADADLAGALTGVQQLLDGGHDLRRFSLDLARHLRDLLVLSAAPDVEGLVDATAERRDRLVQQARRFGTDSLVRAVELVGEVLVEQRQGPPRLPLELAIARLATPGADGDVLALADRVARIETAIGDGAPVPAPAVRTSTTTATTAAEDGQDGHGEDVPPAVAASPATAPTDRTGTAGDGAAAATGAQDADRTPAADEDALATGADEAVPPAVAADGIGAAAAAPTGDAAAQDAETDTNTDTETDDEAAAEPAAAEPTTVGTTDEADDAGPADEDEPDDAADARALAARAAELAEQSEPLPDPKPLAKRPGTTTVERDLPEPAAGGDELERIVAGWDAILEVVAEHSRRAKAFYEPATPVRLGNGVLLLSYPADKRFHAEQGKSGEMTAHLATAIEQVTSLQRIRVDVSLGDDGPRRPTPPPAAGGSDDGPSPAEVAAVAEVEQSDRVVELDGEQVAELLRTELGAQRLEDDEV